MVVGSNGKLYRRIHTALVYPGLARLPRRLGLHRVGGPNVSRFLAMLMGMLIVPGCHRTERQATDVDGGDSTLPAQSALALRSAARPTPSSDTSYWADTVKHGDTLDYSRGRLVTTSKVVVDSQWSVFPMPSILPGIPYGLTAYPPDSLCQSGYTSTVYGIPRAGTDSAGRNKALLQRLDRVRPCNARVWLRIARERLRDSTGKLSVPNAVAEINSWPPQLWTDSTVLGFHLGDDPASADWGGTMAQRLAKWDTIACTAKARGDKKPRLLRARAVQMAMLGRPWQCMTTAASQWVVRLGDPDSFFVREARSAFQQKLGLMVAFNLLQGDNDRPLSGRLIRQSGVAGLKITRACALNPWAYPPAFGSQLHTDTAVAAALKSLGLAASVHPVTSCIQR